MSRDVGLGEEEMSKRARCSRQRGEGEVRGD